MDYGFDDNYIKYSSYKYKLFSNCLRDTNNDYKSICNNMNIYFNVKEEEALFKILELEGYDIRQFTNYHFYKNEMNKNLSIEDKEKKLKRLIQEASDNIERWKGRKDVYQWALAVIREEYPFNLEG